MSRPFILGALLLANLFVWTIPVPHGVTVSFLDVGHGRAILIQSPTGAAVLIDGGPDSSVFRGIGSTLPFFVRSLDAVVETNPDASNIGGLPDVFHRYRVRAFLEPGGEAATKAAQALADEVAASRTHGIVARRGIRLILGNGAYADVLFPDGDLIPADPHSGSLVIRVVYGRTSLLLPSDVTQKAQARLIRIGSDMRSDVLAIPHYGSKDSLAEAFLLAVAPRYAVLSYGCDNRWGYPAPDITGLFQKDGVQMISTCEDGTVRFVSDGKTLREERSSGRVIR